MKVAFQCEHKISASRFQQYCKHAQTDLIARFSLLCTIFLPFPHPLQLLTNWQEHMPIPKQWQKTAHFLLSQPLPISKITPIIIFLLALEKSPFVLNDYQLLQTYLQTSPIPLYLKNASEIIELLHTTPNFPPEIKGKERGIYMQHFRENILRKNIFLWQDK